MRVINTTITEVNLLLFLILVFSLIYPSLTYLYVVYRLLREVFMLIAKTLKTACRQNTDKLTYVIFVCKTHHWALYHMLFQNKMNYMRVISAMPATHNSSNDLQVL